MARLPILHRFQPLLADALFGAARWVRQMSFAGPTSRHARRFLAVGDNTVFAYPPGPSFGEEWIKIGSGTLIGPHVSLSAGLWPNEDLGEEGEAMVQIGDRCNVGRGTAIAGRMGIRIGDEVTIAPNVFITDHNHDYADPHVPVTRQWIVEDPVMIGRGSWIGVGAVILPGTTLGDNVVVAAGSVVRGEVPARSVVAGVPARVVRRWDAEAEKWDPPLISRHRAGPAPEGWFN